MAGKIKWGPQDVIDAFDKANGPKHIKANADKLISKYNQSQGEPPSLPQAPEGMQVDPMEILKQQTQGA